VSKLISWNIGWRVKARGEQLEWIAKEQADVVALQEVARASELQQKLFELGFEHFECTKPTAGRKKLVAIASREPFTVTPPLPCRIPNAQSLVECLSRASRSNCIVSLFRRVRLMDTSRLNFWRPSQPGFQRGNCTRPPPGCPLNPRKRTCAVPCLLWARANQPFPGMVLIHRPSCPTGAFLE
jgi:endonuclease/exonuclease/phosphatase family protein